MTTTYLKADVPLEVVPELRKPWSYYWATQVACAKYRANLLITTALCCLTPPGLPERSREIAAHTERKSETRKILLNNHELQAFANKNSHSHPASGAMRTAVNEWMISLTQAAGFEPFCVSMSDGDQKRHLKGTRLYFHAKDTALQFQHDMVDENSVIIMTDVDYYTDINRALETFQPILIYTLYTPHAAVSTKEFSCRWVGKEVEYRVSGGSSYRHELWDYKGDTVSIRDRYDRLVTYNLEVRNIPNDPYHRFIALTPMTRIEAPYWYDVLEDMPIKRFCPVSERGIVSIRDPVAGTISLAVVGSWFATTLEWRTHDSIYSRCKRKQKVEISDIERMLQGAGDNEKTAEKASFLIDLLERDFDPNVVLTNGTISYQATGLLKTEEGTVPGQALTTPIVTQPALFAAGGSNATAVSVKERITKVKNTRRFDTEMKNWAKEFMDLMVPKHLRNTGVPLDPSDVMQKQTKANQKLRQQRCEGSTYTSYSHPRLTGFLKAEPYPNVGPPRMITTIDAAVTTTMSGFTYAFKEVVLTKLPWYGPGKDPVKQALRLEQMSRKSSGAIAGLFGSDFSKFDGTVSEDQQLVYKGILMSYFKTNYRSELQKHYDAIFMKKARSGEHKYDMGWGTRSGSPITTDANTVINAFTMFMTLRLLGYKPVEAWDKLGMFYGDDCVQQDEDGLEEAYLNICERSGLKAKPEHFKGAVDVGYLGRVFPHPPTSLSSYADPLRTMCKIHLSSNKQVSREQAAYNKASGYIVTDAKTPVIGAYAKKVCELSEINEVQRETSEESFKATMAWPQDDEELIRESFSRKLGVDMDTVAQWEEEIRAVTSLDGFRPLLANEREIKIPAIVDGLFCAPAVIQSEQEDSPTTEPQSSSTTAEEQDGPQPSGSGERPREVAGSSPRSPPPSDHRPGRQKQRLPPKVRRERTNASGGRHERRDDTAEPTGIGSGSTASRKPRRSRRQRSELRGSRPSDATPVGGTP